ncbi:MAG: VanZ family protein [Nitrospirota bacterium]|nr:VanZ family protein [Nitrospirota bacterium]
MFLLTVWFAMILIASVVPVAGVETDLPADKVVHFVMYGLTAILLFRFFERKTTLTRACYSSVAVAALYGAGMEVVQYFLPYRSFSAGDMAANTTGAFLACVLYVKGKKLWDSSQ